MLVGIHVYKNTRIVRIYIHTNDEILGEDRYIKVKPFTSKVSSTYRAHLERNDCCYALELRWQHLVTTMNEIRDGG